MPFENVESLRYYRGHGILAVTFMSIQKKLDVVHALLSL
jgi:hypothetical protein